MTAALCLSGQLRCFKQAYPSIKEHLIDPLKADVYASHWNYLLPDERNQEDGTMDEFSAMYKPGRATFDNFGELESQRLANSPLCQHAAEGVHVDRMLAMWIRIQRAFELANAVDDYDLYIRCRCDLKFLSVIPLEEILTVLDSGQIGIPVSRDYDTIRNDQFAFGGFEAMRKYVSVYDSIQPLVDKGFKIHPERLLFEHLKLVGLTTYPSTIQYRVLRHWGEENPCVTEAYLTPNVPAPVSNP